MGPSYRLLIGLIFSTNSLKIPFGVVTSMPITLLGGMDTAVRLVTIWLKVSKTLNLSVLMTGIPGFLTWLVAWNPP